MSVVADWLGFMTVQQLRTPEVTERLSAARRCLEAAAAVPPGALGVDDLVDGISEVAALEAQAGALRLRLLAEADGRQVAWSLGATGTDAWAAQLTGTTRAVMSGGIWLARLLESTYHATREAFAEGGINEAQVRVIVQAAETLPDSVSADQRRAAEAGLVVKAINGVHARGLRQAARRMLDVVSRDLANQHEADLLHVEERRAEVETWMTLGDNGDGTFSGRFVIPELHGHMLRAALEHLTSPHRLSRNQAGDVVQDDTLAHGGLSWTEMIGVGFTELIEHLPSEGFGRMGTTLMVHLDYQHLLDGLVSASLDTGTRISAGEARRLACGAGIVPAVFSGSSQPLDVGRELRLHTRAMRQALSAQHEACAAEGCQRPFAWCDIHHPHAWSHGGPTSVANGIPLCAHHHRRAHDACFDLRFLDSGEVRFRRRR